ncbi:hypothetical protein PILCRDRAFT_816143 [Piloderma croceum F 1598]|uniref:Uncharacterized protein n=1 Tax=Piloderma croceum (strain F 1598) TaxID=765440 RepID=A0A0C3G6D1_PILCF|nr:hypothetical protein PILCRDRAFT_816143 [Piloderma croceum F 1598]
MVLLVLSPCGPNITITWRLYPTTYYEFLTAFQFDVHHLTNMYLVERMNIGSVQTRLQGLTGIHHRYRPYYTSSPATGTSD